ncbi:putative cell division protein FtsK [Oscillibacter valericigenes Sjm18-20]|nr:putative cell division protein FtsK [Oscillibacter valericigenes Sjm18-20]
MSTMLSVYTQDAFEEILLPAIDNSNFSFRLDRERYGLDEHTMISLEVADGRWRLLSRPDYQIFVQNAGCSQRLLEKGDIVNLRLAGEHMVTIAVTEAENELGRFSKYSLAGLNSISVGKATDNVICLNGLGLVSAHHAQILRQNGGWLIQDISTNGTYVGTERIKGQRMLQFGDCINIFGTKLVYLGELLALNISRGGVTVQEKVLHPAMPEGRAPAPLVEKKLPDFRRSPRNIPKVCEEKLDIETPPVLQSMEDRPLLLTIGPSFTMAIPMLLGCLLAIYGRGGAGGIYMYTGLVTAISSAVIGVMWALINLRYAKKQGEEHKQLRFQAYSNYLIRITDYLKEKQTLNAQILREAYPSAEECATYSRQESRLWNRNFSHEDVLLIRVGMGDIPFQMDIHVPSARFSMTEDSMAEKPRMLAEQYRILRDVPIGVNLLDHPMVGIVSTLQGGFDLVRMLTVQIAATHCYTDVKLAFVGENAGFLHTNGWDFARWLPHVWSEDRKFRYFARNAQESREVLYELSRVFRARTESGDGIPKPHYILFLDDASILENEPISKYLLEPKPEYGVTTVLLSETYEGLPNACQYIVQNDADFSGMYSVSDLLDQRQTVRFDQLSVQHAERFARGLSGVRVNEVESGGDIPAVLDFFDMMGVDTLEELAVADRWRKNRTYESLRALVGKKAGSTDCYLDIHEKYHGPHGLVAGTTGSGKSETLQTYILSLAVNFSPQDVAFLLIDFKGGGMANLFTALPHTVGQISNLSGSQIRRAMVSIKSENQRRQRIFSEYGVNHIDGYTKLFKNKEAPVSIPHLLIIIDEFAELKREEPDFMRELISVAQVGRSLGVHLILATQKPGGTVDDSIRSNTKFRLCLRVQDRQDSMEMLHRPDAAYITQAGRCYLQVGNDEVYELFQSGWSGARYDPEQRKNHSTVARMVDDNGRTVMAGNRSELLRKEQKKREWATLLAKQLQAAAADLNCDLAAHPQEQLAEVADVAAERLNLTESGFLDSSRNRGQLQKLSALWPAQPGLTLEKIAEGLAKSMEVQNEKLPECKEITQLDAVVEYLAVVAQKEHCENRMKLWLPALPEKLSLEQLAKGQFPDSVVGQWPGESSATWTLETVVGLYDAPENQMQVPLSVNFAEGGHLAVCGIVNSGKSTFLETMIYGLVNRYSPAHLNVYALDFGGGKLGVFRGLAHVGGVLDDTALSSVQKFFRMIEKMLEERQRLFAGANYSQYVKAHEKTLPAVLIVIDQYGSFREKTDNAYDGILLRISNIGVSCGIYLAVSAGGFGSAEIPSRLADNFRTAISLEMGDKFKYGDVLRTMRFSILPEPNIRGRGLVGVGGSILEFQTALPVDAEDDYQLSEQVAIRCRRLNEVWSGVWARPVPVIPKNPVWEEFSKLEDCRKMLQDDRHLPLGYLETDASVYGVDLSRTFCYLISGKARTGRTTAMRLLIESAAAKGGRVVVIDKGGELKRCAEGVHAVYVPDRKALSTFVKELYQEYPDRNQKKRQMVERGISEEEIYIAMDYKKWYVFIHDMDSFLRDVYAPADSEAGIPSMNGFLENVFEKGKLHQVYFFASIDSDRLSDYNGRRLFNSFIGYRTGLHLGGEVDRQRVFTFENIPYGERTRTSKAGQALAASTVTSGQADKLILPMWKG